MSSNTPLSNEQKVRRTLLKIGAYVPPTILGVMLNQNVVMAEPVTGQPKTCKGGGTIIVSANGNACCPCIPSDPKYNPLKCQQKKCKLGNCSACKGLAFTSLKKCNQKVAKSGCGTCTRVGNGKTYVIK